MWTLNGKNKAYIQGLLNCLLRIVQAKSAARQVKYDAVMTLNLEQVVTESKMDVAGN